MPILLLALALLFARPASGEDEAAFARLPVTARAVPLNDEDPAQREVGRLRYLGGIELSSTSRRLGGISGIRFTAQGKLLAITDAGDWIRLALAERDGRLTGIASAELATMRGPDGATLKGKGNADAEALEITPSGAAVVAFERDHRLLRFGALLGESELVQFPDRTFLTRLPGNAGIEAMAQLGPNWLFMAEEPGGNPYDGVLQARRGMRGAYGRIDYNPPPGFKPTDAHALGEDAVLILNRRYAPLIGVAAVLQLVPLAGERLGLGEPQTLATLTSPLTVDNFEGLAVRSEGDRTFIYIASDDNFSPLQRTLLMKFELLPAG